MSKITTTVIASGLDNPRNLTFGPDGALYVTEAGAGGDGVAVPAPEIGTVFNYGETGAITRIQDGEQERILTELPSLALEDGSQAFGPQGIGFDENGDLYFTVGFSTSSEVREENLGPTGSKLGRLYKYNLETGEQEKLADFVDYEGLNNSDGGSDLVSNPYDLLIQEDDLLVLDAGANVLLNVDKETGNNISLNTIFGPRNVNGAPMQSVPTDLEIGPDGAYYVSEFTGVPYPEDEASIYRFEPGERPEVYADGFSNISDIAFGNDGSLYVLEFDSNSLSSEGESGGLIKLSPDGTRTTLIDDLLDPSGLLVGDDGAIYVSNNGDFANEGEIIKIEEHLSEEPLSFGSSDSLMENDGYNNSSMFADGDSFIFNTDDFFICWKSTAHDLA